MIALPASNTDTAPDDKVGRRLRHLRKARGLSLRQLADASSLSIGFLSQIERGQSSPSLRTLTRLADSLSVGIGELFADEDEAAGGDRRVVAMMDFHSTDRTVIYAPPLESPSPTIGFLPQLKQAFDTVPHAEILAALARGETPKTGSQIGRTASCPEGGPTTLITESA
jgi:transcriptional regulator with XRE-family HTH domain